MGPQLHLPDSQAGGLTEVYDRLASLLDRHDPGRLAAFWEGLPKWQKATQETSARQHSGHHCGGIWELHLTPYAVGKMSRTDISTILRLINGERSPTLDTADRICRALDLVLVTRAGSTLAVDLERDRAN